MTLQEQVDQLDSKKCLIISLVIAVIYYFYFFDNGQNIKSQIEKNHGELVTKKKELEKINVSLSNKEKYELENKKLFENMKDFERYLTSDMTESVILSNISKYAEQSEVFVRSLKPDESSEEFPNCPEQVIFTDISGQYHDIMDFISKLTQMERVIDFKKMSLKAMNKGEIPIVNLNMDLVVYGTKSTDESDKDKDKNQ